SRLTRAPVRGNWNSWFVGSLSRRRRFGFFRRGLPLEPRPVHPAPLALAAQEVPERLHLEERERLTVEEVLEDAEEEELQEVLPGRVAPEGHLLEEDRGDRQEDAVEDRDREEEQEEGRVEQAEGPGEHDGDITQNLDEGPERLEDHEVRVREQAEPAVARVEEHPLVPPQALQHAPVPAVALAEEDLPGGR